MRPCRQARFGGQPRGLPAVARSTPGRARLACQAEARAKPVSAKAGINAAPQGFTSGVASLRGRGAGVARQPVPHGAAADPCAGRRRGSGAGDVSEGVSRGRQLRARHEPEGLVVHDSPQHRPEPRRAIAPATPCRSTARWSTGRRSCRRPAASSKRPKRGCCATRWRPSCRPRSTRCPTRFARRSGYVTWKSFPTPKSPRCSRFRSAPSCRASRAAAACCSERLNHLRPVGLAKEHA